VSGVYTDYDCVAGNKLISTVFGTDDENSFG
jgi:hypothetical protein